MKKKLLILISILIFSLLGYRLLFCYTILPFGISSGLKHKIYGVFHFPSTLLNPLKINSLRKEIVDYVKSDEFNTDISSFSELHNGTFKIFNADYVESYGKEILKGNFEIVSIKKENDDYHILTRQNKNKEATLVFIINDRKVSEFY